MSNPAVILNKEINFNFFTANIRRIGCGTDYSYLENIIRGVKEALKHSDPVYAYELLEKMHSSGELKAVCRRYPAMRSLTDLFYNLLLEHFASEGFPQAKEKLVCLYLTGGEGIEQSVTRALELSSQSVTLQPSLFNAVPSLLKLHKRYYCYQSHATDFFDNEAIKCDLNEIDLAMLIENIKPLSRQIADNFQYYSPADAFFSQIRTNNRAPAGEDAAQDFAEHIIRKALEGIKNPDVPLNKRLSAVQTVIDKMNRSNVFTKWGSASQLIPLINGIYNVSTAFSPASTERKALNILITRYYCRLHHIGENAGISGSAVAGETLEKYAPLIEDSSVSDYPDYQREYLRKSAFLLKLSGWEIPEQKLQLINRFRELEKNTISLQDIQLIREIEHLSLENVLEEVLLSGVSGAAALKKRAGMLSRIYRLCLAAVDDIETGRQDSKKELVAGILSCLPVDETIGKYDLRTFLNLLFLRLFNKDLDYCIEQLSYLPFNDKLFYLVNYYCRLCRRNNSGHFNAESFQNFLKNFYRKNSTLYNFHRCLYGSELSQIVRFLTRLPAAELSGLFACKKRKTEFMQFILSYIRSVMDQGESHKTVLKKLLKALLKADVPHDRETRYYVAAIKQSLITKTKSRIRSPYELGLVEVSVKGSDFLVSLSVRDSPCGQASSYEECMRSLSLYETNEYREYDAAYLLLNYCAENMRHGSKSPYSAISPNALIIKKLNNVRFNTDLAADYKLLAYRNKVFSPQGFRIFYRRCLEQKLNALVAHECLNFMNKYWLDLFMCDLGEKTRRNYLFFRTGTAHGQQRKRDGNHRGTPAKTAPLTPVIIRGRRKFTKFLKERFYDVINADQERVRKYALQDFPDSFIISGAPGTGKTFAVDLFARSTSWNIHRITFGNIGSSLIHEAAKKIHAEFEKAKDEAPCIVIIDEADAILNDRDDMRNEREFKIEEVSAFLQELQSARDNRILVICITNNLDEIDPAIKREGRLGAHFRFENPDETDAAELVEDLIAKVPHEDLDFAFLGKAFAGLSMARIDSIINLAKQNAFALDCSSDRLTQAQIMDALWQGQGLTVPDACFRLPAHMEVEQFINEEIIPFLKDREVYQRFNIPFPSSVLLYGPPGTGKTDIANRIANYLQWSIFRLDAFSGLSESVHGSARKINDVFRQATLEAPSIVLIDEADMFLPSRSSCSQSGIEQVNTLLANISEAAEHNIMVIATTNRPEALDNACKRNGRFSRLFFIGYPDEKARAELIREELETIPTEEDIDFQKVATRMTGYSASDVVAAVEQARKLCCRQKSDMVTERILLEAVKNFGKNVPVQRRSVNEQILYDSETEAVIITSDTEQ